MNYVSNISRIDNYWTRFQIEYEVWDIFLCYFISCAQQLKITKLPTMLYGTRPIRPTIAHDPRNLADSIWCILVEYLDA